MSKSSDVVITIDQIDGTMRNSRGDVIARAAPIDKTSPEWQALVDRWGAYFDDLIFEELKKPAGSE